VALAAGLAAPSDQVARAARRRGRRVRASGRDLLSAMPGPHSSFPRKRESLAAPVLLLSSSPS